MVQVREGISNQTKHFGLKDDKAKKKMVQVRGETSNQTQRFGLVGGKAQRKVVPAERLELPTP